MTFCVVPSVVCTACAQWYLLSLCDAQCADRLLFKSLSWLHINLQWLKRPRTASLWPRATSCLYISSKFRFTWFRSFFLLMSRILCTLTSAFFCLRRKLIPWSFSFCMSGAQHLESLFSKHFDLNLFYFSHKKVICSSSSFVFTDYLFVTIFLFLSWLGQQIFVISPVILWWHSCLFIVNLFFNN
jgi:hypothetical protein